jgi:hypothetical protein
VNAISQITLFNKRGRKESSGRENIMSVRAKKQESEAFLTRIKSAVFNLNEGLLHF